MSLLENLNDKATQTVFNKKVVATTQHLQTYVKHRLYIAESTKVIPKNMFTSNDIIDEAVAKFYENGYDIDLDEMGIKLKLFKIVDKDLDNLFEKEAFHKKTTSTDIILKEELDGLEELYTIDEDYDFIMNEELNDISYKQDNKQKYLFLYDDDNKSFMNALEIKDLSSTMENNKILGKIYTWLPIRVSSIVDLYVFGKLNYDEIASVKNTEVIRVVRVIELAKKSFKS
ncbi:MAG: hypothetical protein NWQ07_03790 [Flaviramulus sp.]|nr:hypothetical protein [Flaviramulus sp.]